MADPSSRRHRQERGPATVPMATTPPPPEPQEQVCRECGYPDRNACMDALDGPVWWIEQDLCSVCAAQMQAAADPAYAGLYAHDGPPDLP